MMKIIPAIDIIDGKCVRLSKGDYSTKKIYNEDPLEVAREFEDFGIQFLHLVDLDGAKSKHIVNQKVLENIAKSTSLHIDFGGGLKTSEDIETAFNSGAKQITLGSIAVQDPEFCFKMIGKYGPRKLFWEPTVKTERLKLPAGWKKVIMISLILFLNIRKRNSNHNMY
jgi:phosphoribosylformimino-5-aminoimidazole carboxamide ribotide isomerase